jgi:PAS domain S-box-containing protein
LSILYFGRIGSEKRPEAWAPAVAMFGLVNRAESLESTALAQLVAPIAAVLLAQVARLAIRPVLGEHASLLLFSLATMIAARYGGRSAGLLATGLSSAFGLFTLVLAGRAPALFTGDITFLVLFTVVGAGISILTGQLRRAWAISAAQEEQRRIVTENVPQLLWTCRPDGACDFLNGRWVNYTGISADVQLGDRWLDRLHPDDRESTLSAWAAALASGDEFRSEFRLRRFDGAYRWFDTRAIAVRDRGGHVLKWFGSSTDVHEARVARDELRAEQARLNMIVSTAPGVICSFRLRPDGTTCFPYASPKFEDIYGISPGLLVDDSSPAFRRMHPDDIDAVHASVARSAETMQPWRAEFRVIHPDTGERWVEGHSQPVKNADGSVEWYGFLNDITARRQTEQKLRDRSAALEELTRTLDLAHAMVRSLDGRITYWSQGAASLYGWTAAEAVGRLSHELLHTEFPRPLSEIQAELLRSGRWEGELRHFCRDGAAVDVASHWALHCDVLGHPHSIIEVNNDISEQKRVERELRASEERLELAQAAAGIVTWDWYVDEDRALYSAGYGELYGLSPGTDALSPAAWIARVHPEDRADVQAALSRAVDGVGSYEAEFRIVMPDGGVRWLVGKGQGYRDSSGRLTRVIGINYDITERKLAAERLRALSASLISAQEQERRRISRELHDDLVQRLGLMAIDVGRLNSRFGRYDPELGPELRALQERAAEAAELTRHIAHELHPWILDDLGIETALRSLCAEVGRREEVDIRFVSGQLPEAVPREIASCLYAVAQESLQNVSKHAKAKHVEVRLHGSNESVRLEVRDDGIGCSVEAVAGGLGLGVVNMRERVRWAKGVFHLDSQPGRGVCVAVDLPRSGV